MIHSDNARCSTHGRCRKTLGTLLLQAVSTSKNLVCRPRARFAVRRPARRRHFHRGLQALASGFSELLISPSRSGGPRNRRLCIHPSYTILSPLCSRIRYVFLTSFGEVGGCSWPPRLTSAAIRICFIMRFSVVQSKRVGRHP